MTDLINANLIKAGTTLFVEYKGIRYEGVLRGDGSVIVEDTIFKTPSAAGGAVTAKHNVSPPNGWAFWSFIDANGNTVVLDTIRQAYMKQNE